MPSSILYLLFLGGFVWLIILSFIFWKLFSHYNKLIKKADGKNISQLLDTVLSQQEELKKELDILKVRCDTIEKEGKFHIQKIGLVRFNPFKDTGGDQSFIVGLLNGNDSGVVISGLYSRSGTRWYAKRIKEGKGVEHELSDEEKGALQEAKRH